MLPFGATTDFLLHFRLELHVLWSFPDVTWYLSTD
jgi:hypothetical protein